MPPRTPALARSPPAARAGRSRFCWGEERRRRKRSRAAAEEAPGRRRAAAAATGRDTSSRRHRPLRGRSRGREVVHGSRRSVTHNSFQRLSPGSPIRDGEDGDGLSWQGESDGDRRERSRGPGEGSLWEPLLHLCTGPGARWPSGMSKIW